VPRRSADPADLANVPIPKFASTCGTPVASENSSRRRDGDVKVYENTDKLVNLVIPTPPVEGEMSDEDLEKVAAGVLLGGKGLVKLAA
jgi:hypothetical protein